MTTTAGTGYTGTVSWSGSPSTFAAGTIYTATITLTPSSGYTLTGVSADFFTIDGATSVSNSANSGVITAVFPAAPRTISTLINISVRRPITGETPASAIVPGPGYTGTVSWSGSPTTFAAGTIYTATITLSPSSGYTLTGVSANSFQIPGVSVTHPANSGVITAVFPATDATISVAAIAGVTAPVTGATPVTATTAGTGYTGTVSWSGSPSTFAAETIYTATISLTEAIGYTFTGVSANFFAVAGATSVTHSANSGVITATFPATSASQSPQTKTSQSITFTDPADIVYGQSPAALSATSTSALTVAFTTATPLVCGVSGTTLTINAAGTCTINANQPGNDNYQAATQVVQSFTITPPTAQSITFATPTGMTLGGATQTVAPTATSSLTVTLASTTTGICTVTGFVITAVASGTCSITASQSGNANYAAATDVVRTFTISLAAQSITFDTPQGMTVGGAQVIATTATSSLTVTLTSTTTGICTVSGSAITAVASGTCSITASQSGNATYAAATDVVRTFTIAASSTTVINVAAIAGVTAPVTGATPVTTTTAGSGYTGTVSWSGSPSTFAAGTTYTATITLTPTSGYTLTGVSANFFTVAGATSVTHSANSGFITATFPATEGAATKVVITRAPAGTQRRTAFTTQPQITIRDASDNTVTSSTAVVTATLTSGFQGTLIGSNTATAVSGVATFNDLGIDGTGGGSYTITYRVDGLTVATSTTVLTGINCDGRSFTCKRNDIGPGGGKVFYVSSGNFTQTDATGSMCSSTCKYLEVAPDLFGQLQWTGLPYEPTLIGTSDGIGTGYSNTLKIVGQSQAASAARNYTGNGLNDWFLPSNSELAEIAGFNSIFGGFLVGRAYWSSTEFDATRARYYVFNSFGGIIETKQSYYTVLAVRAF
jgi:hypothetical protein